MTEAVIRKKPGMASVKDMPVLQDGPPPGSFPPIRYVKRIPSSGPSAMAIFLAAFGVFSYGMYQVGKGNKIRRSLPGVLYLSEVQVQNVTFLPVVKPPTSSKTLFLDSVEFFREIVTG